MAEGQTISPIAQVTGKLATTADGKQFIGRLRNGKLYFSYYNPSLQDRHTPAMEQGRVSLSQSQQIALAIEQNPEELARWQKLYAKALAHHERHPNAYAEFRSAELKSQHKRVRPNSLAFPSDLRHYIISSLMRNTTPWT